MSHTKYLVIGNSSAGLGAVEGIRKNDKTGKIIVLTREKHPSYSRPFIVNYAGKKTPFDKIVFNNPKYLENLKAEVLYEQEVKKILDKKNEVELSSGEKINYEKLLIASGGKPIFPPIKGDNLKQVITFMTLDDAEKMREYATQTNRVVVLGGGLIGLKATEALVDIGVPVVMIELADYILSRVIDEKASMMMVEQLEKRGVTVKTKNTIEEILGKHGHVTGVRLKDGTEIECGLVVIAIGVLPNVDFVDKKEIQVNRGLVVNDYLQTSIANIYAAGDVAEALDMVTGEKAVIAIWPIAKKQGYYAGLNMSGAKKRYQGGLVENVLEFNDMPVISYGIVNVNSSDKKYEVLIDDSKKGEYIKLVIKGKTLVGAVLVNNLRNPGVYRDLIINKMDISEVKDDLLKEDFGWKYFPKPVRDQKFQDII